VVSDRVRGAGEGDKATELFYVEPDQPYLSRADLHRRYVEPYVVAADIYAAARHGGREVDLVHGVGRLDAAGRHRKHPRCQDAGNLLRLDPCIPRTWRRYEISVRFRSALYEIVVENPEGVARGVVSARMDGKPVMQRPLFFALLDDGMTHKIEVTLGPEGAGDQE
jgi:cyclic beta-1,2-glucan synthetase